MLLSIRFDITACDKNQESSVLELKKLGLEQCKSNFRQIEVVCAQDKGWARFDPEFTLEGGVYGRDCAIWSLSAASMHEHSFQPYLVHTTSGVPAVTYSKIEPSL